ncbi:hypothetical protein AS594_07075 [Streptomyces agglomeratus]|uniref:Uncharacterized protein n=1 Tax=Streptomyces agglomeratus TaxID=285458 RepID=A0A1E5P4L5_9ACTN|nr:hypothetical protein [Streptomyces agglomeratus]OEJ24284.1 hypothetical protein AS594_07075 [Streptomyces agglomeratus]
MSKRTDGGPGQPVRAPSGGAYGERQNLEQLQQSAPLSATPGGDVGSPEAVDVSAGVIGFDQGTQLPDEPVTAGAALGEGPGLEALGLPDEPTEDMSNLLKYLPVLEHMANQPGASKAGRNLVRRLKGMAT